MNSFIRKSLVIGILGSFTAAQAQVADSVVIRVGKESKVTFSIKDKKDLETLKHYDFQALMDDMFKKLEARDTTPLTKASTEYLKDTVKKEAPAVTPTETNEDWDSDWNDRKSKKRSHGRKTHHSFNIDLGMNNYLQNGKFPTGSSSELYTVKPWGSWYVGLNSILRTRVSRKLFLEWGGGVSWYNFKFENYKTVISKDDNGVIFSQDTRDLDFQKSKLTVAYVNISAIPVFDFGDNGRKSTFFDGYHSSSFRIGFGPYVGYRLDSYTKQMWYENGEKHKSHDHDSFYLDNFRYGVRLQLGFRDTDIFINYDLNELFLADKGPKLNAISFGITL